MLLGPDAHKSPFKDIVEIEGFLAANYSDLVESERKGGRLTEEIVEKVKVRVRTVREREKAFDKTDDDGEVRAPKPGQVYRALNAPEYSNLEVKWLDRLQSATMSLDDKMVMFKDAFTSGSVLPTAVLLNTKGMRTSIYTGTGGSEFLALLWSERELLCIYLGQSLAFDLDQGGIPKDLCTFRLDDKVVTLVRDLAWDKIDWLNDIILKLRGAEAGTKFARHNSREFYHDGDMLAHLQEHGGRLYESLGYPRTVPQVQGMSFHGAMGALRRIQKFAVGLAPDEQKAAFTMIDSFALRLLQAAANHAKRVIYGASPCDRVLVAWVPADEPVSIDLRDVIDGLRETVQFRRRTGGIFTETPQAATLTGHKAEGGANGGGDDKKGGGPSGGPRGKGKPNGRKLSDVAAKKAAEAAATGGGGGGKSTAKVGESVDIKRIVPYTDGTFSIGTRTARTPCPVAPPLIPK